LVTPPARYVTTALVDVTERLALVASRSINSDAAAGAADANAATTTARLAEGTRMRLRLALSAAAVNPSSVGGFVRGWLRRS
jgi:hypothetical protein